LGNLARHRTHQNYGFVDPSIVPILLWPTSRHAAIDGYLTAITHSVDVTHRAIIALACWLPLGLPTHFALWPSYHLHRLRSAAQLAMRLPVASTELWQSWPLVSSQMVGDILLPFSHILLHQKIGRGLKTSSNGVAFMAPCLDTRQAHNASNNTSCHFLGCSSIFLLINLIKILL
jgi:hypothetical protein